MASRRQRWGREVGYAARRGAAGVPPSEPIGATVAVNVTDSPKAPVEGPFKAVVVGRGLMTSWPEPMLPVNPLPGF